MYEVNSEYKKPNYAAITITFGIDIVNRVVRNLESDKNVILYFMGNEQYEKYMRDNGIDNFKISCGPTYDGANQCLNDCWPEIYRFFRFVFDEQDFIAVQDKWLFDEHSVSLYSKEKFCKRIKINFPLFSANSLAYNYIADRIMKEVSYEDYKRTDKEKKAAFRDASGTRRYAVRV